jgi:uncharacterized protein YuzE
MRFLVDENLHGLCLLLWRWRVRIRYDPRVDAAYIFFQEGSPQVTTVRLTEDVAIDFGPNEEIFGIEVLDASRHLGIRPEAPSVRLENLKAAS